MKRHTSNGLAVGSAMAPASRPASRIGTPDYPPPKCPRCEGLGEVDPLSLTPEEKIAMGKPAVIYGSYKMDSAQILEHFTMIVMSAKSINAHAVEVPVPQLEELLALARRAEAGKSDAP